MSPRRHDDFSCPGFDSRVLELEQKGVSTFNARRLAECEARSRPPAMRAYRVTFKRTPLATKTEAWTRYALDFQAAQVIVQRDLAEEFLGAAVLLSIVELVK